MDAQSLLLFGGETSSGGGGGGVGIGPADIGPWTAQGLHLHSAGRRTKYRGITGFSLVHEVKHGNIEKARRYCRWGRSLGFNILRAFCTWNNLGLKADREAVRATLVLLKEEGLSCHLVALCDQVEGSSVRMPVQEQRDWILYCIQVAADIGNAIVEEFNESMKNDDDDVCGDTPKSAYDGVRVLGTRSWWGENQSYLVIGSLLHWTTGHTDRGPQHARSCIQALDVQRRGYEADGENVPPTGIPHLFGENARVVMDGHTPRQDADFAAGALLFGAGNCCHGDWKGSREPGSDLQNCEIPTGLPLVACEAIGDVHRAHLAGLWPMETPDGHYVRGGVDQWNNDSLADSVGTPPILHRDRYFGGSDELEAYEEPEGCARSFFMELDGRYYGLAIDPGPEWTLKIRDGFRLVAQGGYDDGVHGPNLLVLEHA